MKYTYGDLVQFIRPLSRIVEVGTIVRGTGSTEEYDLSIPEIELVNGHRAVIAKSWIISVSTPATMAPPPFYNGKQQTALTPDYAGEPPCRCPHISPHDDSCEWIKWRKRS